MALAKDLSTLPKPDRNGDGNPPDHSPRWTPVLANAIKRLEQADGPKPHAKEGTRWRHSDAAGCARKLGLQALGVPKSDPIDDAGLHVMSLGTSLHERWQNALYLKFRNDPTTNVAIEAKCQIVEADSSGHIDALITQECRCEGHVGDVSDLDCGCPTPGGSHKTVIELKSIGGFGYKLAVGDRGAPQGPRHSAVVQGALNAHAVDADDLVIGYLATEAISKPQAARKGIDDIGRFAAEWTYGRDVWAPIAEAEIDRLAQLARVVDDGKVPKRVIPDPEIPAGAVITDPQKGTWQERDGDEVVDFGSWWGCGYCSLQTACTKVGTTRDATEALKILTDAGLFGVTS